jgi:S1-C subfamily serine protease
MGILNAEFFIFSFGFDTKKTIVNIMANGIKENNKSTTAINYEYVKVYSNKTKKDISFNNVSSGTCFPISRDGLIVTNYHVIENKRVFKIRGVNLDYNKAYNATLVLVDKNNDLAILKISDPTFGTIPAIPYVLKKEQVNVGTNIFVLGFPLRSSMGDELKLTNGIISSKSGFQGDVTTYQISAPVQPGNSGGPLFDNNGDIIGIINAKHKGAENVTYAIKITYLLNLCESLPTTPKLNQLNTLANKPLSKQVEMLRKFVYILEAE